MRFHARSMNAYLYASQLGHIPEQLAWAAAKQGMAAHTVRAAYSSQECLRCHFVDRANRRTQQTFKCGVCGYEDHADHKAAVTLAGRWGDRELAACRDKREVKALLLKRHEVWKQQQQQRIEQARPSCPVELLGSSRGVLGSISSVNISRKREMQRVPVVHPAGEAAVG